MSLRDDLSCIDSADLAVNLAGLRTRTRLPFRLVKAPLREMRECLRQRTSATAHRASSIPQSLRRSLSHARRRIRMRGTTRNHLTIYRRGKDLVSEPECYHFPMILARRGLQSAKDPGHEFDRRTNLQEHNSQRPPLHDALLSPPRGRLILIKENPDMAPIQTETGR